MAKPIIAASCITRNNSVLELVRTFEHVLGCAASSASNSEAKNRYLRAFETLIECGYKAVKECGVSIHIESYQKYLYQNFVQAAETVLESAGGWKACGLDARRC